MKAFQTFVSMREKPFARVSQLPLAIPVGREGRKIGHQQSKNCAGELSPSRQLVVIFEPGDHVVHGGTYSVVRDRSQGPVVTLAIENLFAQPYCSFCCTLGEIFAPEF
jgi:hypothetical protein